MSEIQELKEKANSLRASKNFADAISVYELLFGSYRENCNETDVWSYAVCLQKTGRHPEALLMVQDLLTVYPDYSNIRNVFCWSTYFSKVKIESVEDEEAFLTAATQVIENSRQQDKNYPYLLTVYKVIDYLERKQDKADLMVAWTERLNPELLDDTPQQVTLKDGKEKEFPSDKEKYYDYRTKALLYAGKYDECITTCDEALGTIVGFHFDNDNWLRRRKATCRERFGDVEGALVLMRNVLRHKTHWSIQLEIAKLQNKLGQKREAMLSCLEGAFEHGDFEKKTELYKFMAELLEELGRTDDARKHIAYAYTMRKEANLFVYKDLMELVEKYGIDVTKLYEGKRQAGAIRRIWEEIKYADQEQFTGSIKAILPNGKAAFVEGEGRKSYFFSRKDFKGKDEEMTVGASVTFYLVDGFDTKKNIPTKNAVNVRLLR